MSEINLNNHTVPLETLLARFGTDPTKGLTAAKAAEALARDGPNVIPNASDSYRSSIPKMASVIRDGQKLTIKNEEVVVGDIVEVKQGEQIPADFRVLECDDFRVYMGNLTGESEPQPRGTESTDENPLETHNLVFLGTTAVSGFCKGVVYQTGLRTVYGQVSGLETVLDCPPGSVQTAPHTKESIEAMKYDQD